MEASLMLKSLISCSAIRHDVTMSALKTGMTNEEFVIGMFMVGINHAESVLKMSPDQIDALMMETNAYMAKLVKEKGAV